MENAEFCEAVSCGCENNGNVHIKVEQGDVLDDAPSAFPQDKQFVKVQTDKCRFVQNYEVSQAWGFKTLISPSKCETGNTLKDLDGGIFIKQECVTECDDVYDINERNLPISTNSINTEKEPPQSTSRLNQETNKSQSNLSFLKNNSNIVSKSIDLDTVQNTCSTNIISNPTLEIQKSHKNQLLHKCNLCPKQFFTNNKLKIHVDSVHLELKPYPCDLCDKSFPKKGNLKKHVDMVHKKLKKCQCNVCGKCFSEKRSLLGHITTVHSDRADSDVEQLTNYGPEFILGDNAADTSSESVSEQSKPECSVCQKTFSSKSSLSHHIRRVHLRDESHLCNFCGKSFGLKSTLGKHIERVHHKSKPFQCTQCSRSFAEKHCLKKHIISVHDQVKPHMCTVCDKGFACYQQMLRHVDAVHNRFRPFHCEMCEKTFPEKGKLKKHVDIVHALIRPFQCCICHKSFSTKQILQRHIDGVHKRVEMSV